MLSVIDGLWKDHLLSMDHLKEGIGLRGYAQQDPLVAYKTESFDMFEAMMLKFQEDTVRFLFRMQILGPDGQPIERSAASRGAPFPPLRPWPVPRSPYRTGRQWRARARSPSPPAQPSTTIDALEKEFQRKKQRELAVASRAGAGEAQPAHAAPHRRKSRPQRSLPLRLRQEIQEVPRSRGLTRSGGALSRGCAPTRSIIVPTRSSGPRRRSTGLGQARTSICGRLLRQPPTRRGCR